jgi:hypothetical protein
MGANVQKSFAALVRKAVVAVRAGGIGRARGARRTIGPLAVFVGLAVTAVLPDAAVAHPACRVRIHHLTEWVPCQDPATPPGALVNSCPGFTLRNPDTALDGYYNRYLHIRASVSCREAIRLVRDPNSENGGLFEFRGLDWFAGPLRSWDGHYRGSELRYATERFALTNQAKSLDATYLEGARVVFDVQWLRDCSSIRVGFVTNCTSITPRVYIGVKP